jgi:putative endonuclease
LTVSKKELGDRSEDLAAQYLRQKGYTILDRNWRCRSGELDLIAEKDGLLVFCEVKSSRFPGEVHPEIRVDRRKQMKIVRSANQYLAQEQSAYSAIRFDVVVLKQSAGRDLIEHLENAFWPPDDWEDES